MYCLRFNPLHKFLKVDGVLMYGSRDCTEYVLNMTYKVDY